MPSYSVDTRGSAPNRTGNRNVYGNGNRYGNIYGNERYGNGNARSRGV